VVRYGAGSGKAVCDVYATAIMVLGVEMGLAFADAHRLPVFMTVRADDGTLSEHYNGSFAPYLATD
jgi:thiamine biosynthesis lipoprotein ApbE